MEQHNYGDLEDALDEAQQLDKINALSDEEVQEAIELGKVNLTEAYAQADESKILFSPQIEVFEPFAAHVDASRTNMSAKQLLQTVTSDNNDIPYILNKNYRAMTDIDSPFVQYAKEDGVILYSNYNYLIIFYMTSNKLETLYCPKIKRMTNNTITLKYKLDFNKAKRFNKGDMLFDYTGQTDLHVPKIGYRTNIMYGSFYGYTADDAFVMSESYADRTRIDYSKKIFVPISKEIKYLMNSSDKYFFVPDDICDANYLEYFKIDSSDSMLSEFNNTSTKQSKIFGKSVDGIDGGTIMDFKVHRITKKTFEELEDTYIYTKGMIDEVKDQYELQIEIKKDMFQNLHKVFTNSDQAVEYTNTFFSQWESADTFPKASLEAIATDYRIEIENIDYVLEIEIYKSEPTCIGDKFANVYAGKGVCSLILPDHLMPGGADIIFNPLGLFGRNNWGTIFEMGLARIIEDVEANVDYIDATIERLNFINENFIKTFDDTYYIRVLSLIAELGLNNGYYEEFKTSVKKHGFYLLVDNFPGITFKDFADNFIVQYQETFDINITEKTSMVYSEELMQYMRDRGFVSNIFGSDTVQAVPQDVFFGKNYWIKLFHTSYSKYNAISFANSYSKSTGEPPRGRTKNGGCHISWQSTAALIGHIENNPASKELRTIKSDAVQDKNNFNRKMIKDGKYVMKPKYKSPTVNTLNNGLNMLCLKFSSIYDSNSEESFEEDYSEAIEEIEEVAIDDLFTGGNTDYKREDNIDLVIDEEEVPKHNPVTGEVKVVEEVEEVKEVKDVDEFVAIDILEAIDDIDAPKCRDDESDDKFFNND